MSDTILYVQEGSIATVRLNRPQVYNSFNREMALALQAALDRCLDESVRVVCLTGEGKAFCAGQDLGEVTGPDAPGFRMILGEHYNPIIKRIAALEKPVVAAVNGVAAGAGANIALSCDIVVASESASFIQAFSKIGLVPDSGGTFVLPRLIGRQKASALMMLGEKVKAADAEKMGMLYKVFADTDFATEVKNLLITLSEMPTRGLALTKMLLASSTANTLHDQLREEEDMQIAAGNTADYLEGVQAFMEKRNPIFIGK